MMSTNNLSPFEKAVLVFQKEYASNNSIEVPITKAQLNDLLYKEVSRVVPQVAIARKRMIESGMLLYPLKGDRCILYLEKIKSEAI